MADNKNAVAAANAAEQPAAAPENVNVAAPAATSVEPADAAPADEAKKVSGRAAVIRQLANTEGNELKIVTIKKIDVTTELDRNGQPYQQAIIRLADGSDVLCSAKPVVNGKITHTIERTDTIRMPFNSFIAPFNRNDRYAPVIDKIAEFAEVGSVTDFFMNLKVSVLSVKVAAGMAYDNKLRRNSVSEPVEYDRVFIDIVGIDKASNPTIDNALAMANKLVWQDRLDAIKARREAAAAAAKAAASVTAIASDEFGF